MKIKTDFLSNTKKNNICFVFIPTFAYLTNKNEYNLCFVWGFLEITFTKFKKQ